MNCARINLHVKANADKNEIVEIKPEYVKIKIAAPPEKGKANAELIRYLSNVIGIDKAEIGIISGLSSKIKMVKINALIKEQIIERLKNEIRKG